MNGRAVNLFSPETLNRDSSRLKSTLAKWLQNSPFYTFIMPKCLIEKKNLTLSFDSNTTKSRLFFNLSNCTVGSTNLRENVFDLRTFGMNYQLDTGKQFACQRSRNELFTHPVQWSYGNTNGCLDKRQLENEWLMLMEIKSWNGRFTNTFQYIVAAGFINYRVLLMRRF